MYSFDSRVRYSEVSVKQEMTLVAVLDLLQDCCIFQSEHIGLGLNFLSQHHRAFVLSSWQVIVNRYPMLGENIRINTWPYDFQNFLGSRNFVVEDEEKNVIAYANSLWVFIDTETGRPVKVPKDIAEAYVLEKPYEMERSSRKIKLLNQMEEQSPVPIQRFHIDTNQHVNNEKYVLIAEEYLPADFKVRELRVEYRKEAVLSDTIYPKVGSDGNQIMVSLDGADGKPFAIVEFMEEQA